MIERRKVAFLQIINEETRAYVTEHMWCIKEGDCYRLDNIPFVAKNISCEDIFAVEYDADENEYYFDYLMAVSGNSTLRVFLYNDSDVLPLKHELLDKYGCESEGYLEGKTLAVNVPKGINYKPVRDFLMQGEETGRWTFEESCLAHDY